MKNIYLLPLQNNKSKLAIYCYDESKNIKVGELGLQINNTVGWTHCWSEIELYITSDEEIKEGDYVVQINFEKTNTQVIKCETEFQTKIANSKDGSFSKNKIILTTDSNLIKDGVQEINDTFLEWFVKNSSCEFVELKHIIKEYVDDQDTYGYDVNYYKIIIPKEDLKNPNNQEIMFHKESKEYFYEDIVDGEHKMVWLGKEEPKKDCFSLPNCTCKESNLDVIKGLCKICGNSIIHLGEKVCVKSKQEKSYSEEEVWKLVNKLNETLNIGSDLTLEEWFEQFKK